MILTYEAAKQEDIEKIYALSRQLVDDYEDIGSIPYEKVLAWMHRKIESGIAEYTRILCDGRHAGYYHLCDRDDGRTELDDFYILEPFRGRGIGTKVLEKLLDEAEKDVMLYVFNWNAGALKLYERMGFVTEKYVGKTRRIMVCRKELK